MKGSSSIPSVRTEGGRSVSCISNEQNSFYRLRCYICVYEWYRVSILVIFVLVQPPKYRGPTNVLNYSEASFRSIVLSDPTNTVYYVMFDALWATGIEYVRYLFASLSLKYVYG